MKQRPQNRHFDVKNSKSGDNDSDPRPVLTQFNDQIDFADPIR
tara:strand:- start:225536 stop:225664 length:129 start_codon:yes stop_codon:yes gene_type:complete